MLGPEFVRARVWVKVGVVISAGDSGFHASTGISQINGNAHACRVSCVRVSSTVRARVRVRDCVKWGVKSDMGEVRHSFRNTVHQIEWDVFLKAFL